MGQAFYRKYRSRTFDEVIGQEHVTTTLKNALKSGRISHAYLFTGPRGVGKTSVARILARAVNNLPDDEKTIHLDIIEIDAASNRRIDEIRDLREKVHTAPTSAKYKVYIIDEVHMLTREAFNALLKTLEEPPSHCIFILATTEAHKLPETIISRTQRFNFKPVSGSSASDHIKAIAKKERISIEPAAVDLIVEHGDGSFRDSIGILDQLSSIEDKITADAVRQFLGLPPEKAVTDLFNSISTSNPAESLQILTDLKGQGTSAPRIAERLSSLLRQKLINGGGGSWVPLLLRQLLLVSSSPSPFEQLEICILEAASQTNSQANVVHEKKEKTVSARTESPSVTIVKEIKKTGVPRKQNHANGSFEISMWPDVVDKVKKQAASVYTALRLAEPSHEDDTLTLSFQFPLHQKKISQANNLEVVGRVIEDLSGSKLTIRCVVDKKTTPRTLADNSGNVSFVSSEEINQVPIKAISNIFGSAEVLES